MDSSIISYHQKVIILFLFCSFWPILQSRHCIKNVIDKGDCTFRRSFWEVKGKKIFDKLIVRTENKLEDKICDDQLYSFKTLEGSIVKKCMSLISEDNVQWSKTMLYKEYC